MTPVMTESELAAFMAREYGAVADRFVVEKVAPGALDLRLKVDPVRDIRPGGTVSGPVMFTLADVAAYLVTLAHVGPEALAVTVNATIDFMRRPAPVDMVAKARLLKLGRALAVSDMLLHSVGHEKPVARASLTYSLPPRRVAEGGAAPV